MTGRGDEEPRRDTNNDPVSGEVVQDVGGRIVHAQAVYIHRGPLPDPTDYERYERVLPGSANRILKMTESEAAHRHRIEMGGQFIAAGLALLAVVGGFWLILSGFGIYGVLFTATGVSPMVYAFLRTQRRTGGGERNQTGQG